MARKKIGIQDASIAEIEDLERWQILAGIGPGSALGEDLAEAKESGVLSHALRGGLSTRDQSTSTPTCSTASARELWSCRREAVQKQWGCCFSGRPQRCCNEDRNSMARMPRSYFTSQN